jgi:hypothetical protein
VQFVPKFRMNLLFATAGFLRNGGTYTKKNYTASRDSVKIIKIIFGRHYI